MTDRLCDCGRMLCMQNNSISLFFSVCLHPRFYVDFLSLSQPCVRLFNGFTHKCVVIFQLDGVFLGAYDLSLYNFIVYSLFIRCILNCTHFECNLLALLPLLQRKRTNKRRMQKYVVFAEYIQIHIAHMPFVFRSCLFFIESNTILFVSSFLRCCAFV